MYVSADCKLKWYLIYGPSPKEILKKYTALTGKPAKVPSWSYGLWLSTSFTTDYDEATGKYPVKLWLFILLIYLI
jgi:alpha-glucosidase (family GH31 glycosyl hydrolase)